MNIAELKQRKAKLVNDARSLQDGEVSQETENRFNKIWDEVTDLDKQIQREEKLQTEERKLNEAEAKAKDDNPERSSDELAEFRAALTGDVQAYRSLQQTNSTQAGYLVAPQEMVNAIIAPVDNIMQMRTLANVMKLNKAQSLGVLKRTADVSVATWGAELTEAPEDTSLAYGKREFKPHYESKMIKVSRPLVRNAAVPVEQIIAERFRYAFDANEEQAYMLGDGVDKPLGLFTPSVDGISTSRDVSEDNTATAVTVDGLKSAKYNLKSQYLPKSTWLGHRDFFKQVSKLKDSNGQYLWQPSIQAGKPDMLLGRPTKMSEYAPNTFTTGQYVAMLADFKTCYWIVDVLAFELQVLVEKYATTNQIGYIGRKEVDGQPVVEEAAVRVKLG